ncbi:aminodeoxychorismate synthase component I [Lolliginicoccus suaedae]|uniref:aminodeoxychorismate synthase component I n=1 Tax=Lolliginicoccus suaedae TaxID=2605429 RepID=UPI0011EF4E53|nr:aminodeoxychorismate synthase component I [Lolliginicoccus suaedae]
MRYERLGAGNPAAEVLRALARGARSRGLAPPAALTGDWFGSRAIIAPSIAVAPPSEGAQPFGLDTAELEPPEGAPEGFFGGGWFGYLSYPDGTMDGRSGPLPAAASGYAPMVLRLDADDCWWFESLASAHCPGWVRDAVHSIAPAASEWSCEWLPPDRAAHEHGVESCLEAIRDGEVYQACVCGFFQGRFVGEPVDFFADGITATRPARAAFLTGAWGAVASLSPELFLSRHGGIVESSPIKGTLPITADPRLLRESVKDVAENVMIVDLVRNDLGRLARPGSVTVTELLRIHPAPGVWHLVSTVRAGIDPGVPVADLLGATFPPASVTGTPKLRARRFLQEWEPEPRGVYCGTIGARSPVAGLELNVAIRTVELGPATGTARSCRLGVGGGITIDSRADTEWHECLAKAATIVGLSSRG